MATENLKSAALTGLDGSPSVAPSSGQGAPGMLRSVNGRVSTTTGVTAPSTYALCRVPTNACVKQVLLSNGAAGATGAVDIDIAHSTASDTPPSLQGTIPQIAAADNKLFGAGTAITGAQKNVDITFANIFTTTHQNLPLWQVLTTLGVSSFSQDPGGSFDFLAKTTATLAAGGDLSLEVRYVCDG